MMEIQGDYTMQTMRSKTIVIRVGDIHYTITERDGALAVNLHHLRGPIKSLAAVGQASNALHLIPVEL